MATQSPAVERIAREAHITADGNTIVVRTHAGVGPKAMLDALEKRTGTRQWSIADLSGGYASYRRG